MRTLVSSFILIFLIGCSGNSHLFDKNTNVITGNSSSSPGTTVPYGDACRHSEASNFIAGVMTANPGPCNFEACPLADYVEYSKHEEYSHYTSLHGGNIVGNSTLCKTLKEYGQGCCHQDAIDYIGPSCSQPGPCTFEVCDKSEYQEFFNGDHAFFQAYVAQHGGQVLGNQSLCKTPLGGCTLNSPYVTNYDPSATSENGSCSFRGCNENTYSNYDQNFLNVYNNYINSLGGKPHTGTVVTTCAGTAGCTSPAASNYNPNVSTDDGTCNIECCGLENHEFYDPFCQQGIDAYKDNLTIFGVTSSGTLKNDKNCGNKFGCYFHKPGYVTNVQPGAQGCALCAEDGSCNVQCCGDSTATNFDPQCDSVISEYLGVLSAKGITPSGNHNNRFNCNYPVNGCNFNNGFVTNYGANQKEDGSCDIPCCSKEGFQNYSPSCKSAINEYNQILLALSLPASGNISGDQNCGAPLGCANSNASNYQAGSVESGICNISCCATPGTSNYDPTCQGKIDSYKATLQSMGIPVKGALVNNFNCGALLGCTNSGALNYNPAAGQDDGSCIIKCCSDSNKSDSFLVAN